MKGLAAIPQMSELAIAYVEIEAMTVLGEERIAQLSQWARLDPRLAELLTGYLRRHWFDIRVLPLMQALERQPWPRAILVPLRFAEMALSGKIEKLAIRSLLDSIEGAFSEKSNDMFFIPLQRMNRVILAETLGYQSSPYQRSGFIGSTSLFSKGVSLDDVTSLDGAARQRILQEIADELVATERSVSVEDYRRRCRGLVSRRQAQRDLERCPLFVAVGFTRNQRYLLFSGDHVRRRRRRSRD